MPDENVCSGRSGKEAKLLKELKLDETRLTLEERDQLATLVLKFEDVFALEEGEMGSTSIVQHQISIR